MDSSAGHSPNSNRPARFIPIEIGPYILLGVASLIIAPVFLGGLPCSDDALPHLYRAVQLDVNRRGGAPLLQWGPDLLRGFGYPILAFYAPLSYWIMGALHAMGLDFAVALQALLFASLLLAAWGAYTLACRFLSYRAAFIAGLSYLFAPYLLYDAIQRGALPETLALALLPWALTAADVARSERSVRSVGWAAVVFCMLILAHNVVPMFGLGTALLLGLAPSRAFLRPDKQGQGFSIRGRLFGGWPILAAIILALGVTSFYWLPALAELKYTQSRRIDPPFRDWPRYEQHLLPPDSLLEWPPDPADSRLLNPPIGRSLGAGQALLALIGLGVVFTPGWRRPEWIIFALVAVGASFLASEPSLPIWDKLDALRFIQLPTRFLGPASLSAALLSGLVIDRLFSGRSSPLMCGLVLILPALIVSVSGWPWLYPLYCDLPSQPTRQTLARSTTWVRWYAEAQAEVLPRWVDALPPQDSLIAQYDTGLPVNRLVLPEGASLASWQTRPGKDLYRVHLPKASSLTYQTFYFPGWRARLDGQPLPIRVTSPHGLMAFDLPPGTHLLEVAFGPTPVRVFSLFLSVAFGLVLVAAIRFRRRVPELIAAHQAAVEPRALVALGFIVVVVLGLKWGVVDRVDSPIRADRFHDGRLSGVKFPLAVDFSGEVTYLGYTGPERVESGETFEVSQYWTAQGALGAPYGFSLRVADDAGNVWSQPPGRPFGYADYPGTESWPEGTYARDAYRIGLLPGTPPGEYWLEAGVFRRDIALALTPLGAPAGPDPSQARVGKLFVTPATRRLDDGNLAVDVYSPVTVSEALTLLGRSVPSHPVNSGEIAHIHLLWAAEDESPSTDRSAVMRLVGATGQVFTELPFVIGGVDSRAPQLGSGTPIRDQLPWRIPAGVPAGTYQVQVVPIRGLGVSLETLTVTAPERTFRRPVVQQAIGIEFGDWARLVGVSLDSTSVSIGEELVVDLVWEARGETDRSYRVFAHLRDSDGALRGQSDGVPAEWTRPTTGWLTGEYVLDHRTILLPPDAPAGEYWLFVGLYDAATGDRVPTPGGAEVRVAAIVVK